MANVNGDPHKSASVAPSTSCGGGIPADVHAAKHPLLHGRARSCKDAGMDWASTTGARSPAPL